MRIFEKKITLGLLVGLFVFGGIKFSVSVPLNSPAQKKLTIHLKAKAIVLGPIVTLGDIGSISIPDSFIQSRISSIKIKDAPPPGESSEIRLSQIKKCLRKAGFDRYLNILNGPRLIRVTTAQIEIDKAFIKEEYALNLNCDKTLKKYNIRLVSYIKITYNSI